MGGHGGLNILPQKSWNVYNYDNREKVRLDEEAAAKEEQIKREQSRKRDAEFRLESLRTARGLHAERPDSPERNSTDSKHINLFDGIKIFPGFSSAEQENGGREDGSKKRKWEKKDAAAAAPKVVLPEDEKYRLGYGVAGKGVKAPWYLSRPSDGVDSDACDGESPAAASGSGRTGTSKKSSGKKTLEELREERMKREKLEKERERALLARRNSRVRTSARLR